MILVQTIFYENGKYISFLVRKKFLIDYGTYLRPFIWVLFPVIDKCYYMVKML